MLDDHDREAGALTEVRAYDRQELEQYLALLQEETAYLRSRLEAANARRAAAEAAIERRDGSSGGLASAVHLAMEELTADERAAAEHIADLRERSVRHARQVLAEAEREAVVLRVAVGAALDELEGTTNPSVAS